MSQALVALPWQVSLYMYIHTYTYCSYVGCVSEYMCISYIYVYTYVNVCIYICSKIYRCTLSISRGAWISPLAFAARPHSQRSPRQDLESVKRPFAASKAVRTDASRACQKRGRREGLSEIGHGDSGHVPCSTQHGCKHRSFVSLL